jgi:outer membrane autotransporter protein
MKKKLLLASVLASTLMASNAHAVIELDINEAAGYGYIKYDKAGLNSLNPDNIDNYLKALDMTKEEFIDYRNAINNLNLNYFEMNYSIEDNGLGKAKLVIDNNSITINQRGDNLVDFTINGQIFTFNEDQAMTFVEELQFDKLFNAEDDFKALDKLNILSINQALSNASQVASDIKSGKITSASTSFNTPIMVDNLANQLNDVASVVSNRMLHSPIGQAAGEGLTNFGVWLKAFGSQEKQKQTTKYLGYKANQTGLTVGVDTEVSDQATLGIAYSYVDGKVKAKGKTSKVKSHIGTIYGALTLSDTLFTNLQVNSGRSNVKLATNAKTKANLFGAKLEVGNNFDLGSSLYLVPTVGLRYDNVKSKGFKAGNRNYSATKLQRTAGELGLAFKYVNTGDNFTIIPEVHAKALHIFSGKPKGGQAISVNPIGTTQPLTVPANKTPKNLYTAGCSLNFVQTKAAEFGIGYDYSFRPKFKAHTGSIKARINL